MVLTSALCSCQTKSAAIGGNFTESARSKKASTAAIRIVNHFSDGFAAGAIIGMNLFDRNNPFKIIYTTALYFI